MYNNIGSIGNFQKNKKTVISLIGIGLLSGTAVIGNFFLSQETADVHKIRLDEKLKTPPHPIGMQDKLSPIKPEVKPMALILNGWVSVGNISGYDVQYRKFAIGSDYIYQILGTSSTDGSQLGFACFCANVNAAKTWKGAVNSACDTANPNTPLQLDDPIMGYYSIAGVPIPGGSCCKSVPRVGTTNIPGLPTCG